MFKIKLQTKNGNDIKKKQTFNIVFKTKYRKNLLTNKNAGYYTYKIIFADNILNPIKVFKINCDVISHEDVIVKTIANLFIIVKKLCDKNNILPDMLMFNSTDFGSSNEYNSRAVQLNVIRAFNNEEFKIKLGTIYTMEPFNVIRSAIKELGNAKLMALNPEVDKKKYAKSLHICNDLIQRFENCQEV